jgi:galactoside O-acetyltransferase
MSFYSTEELQTLGLASYGKDVRISRKASIYNPGRISIGNHVRIDDFCVLSAGEGGIEIGDYVHIAVYCSLIGAGKIKLNDFCGLSSRVSIYSSNDDYSGAHLTNPTVPSQFTGCEHSDVNIGKHVIIGSGSVVLPGVSLEEGVAIGALSLVSKSCSAFGVYLGNRRIGERKRDLLELEKQLWQQLRLGSGDKQ